MLEIARPSLICSIKDLKAQVGLPLFNRSRSGDDPTDFGRVILQQAIALLAGADQLERWIETGKGLVSAEIVVGMTSCADGALARICAAHFAESHPGERLS